MLTGGWPHFVFMITNLKWTLSTGGQPSCQFTPQSPICPVNTLSSPLKPQTPLPHCVLLVDDLASHFTEKIKAFKENIPCSPPPLTRPASVPLCSAFLPITVDKWSGLYTKTNISLCSLHLFLFSHLRILLL